MNFYVWFLNKIVLLLQNILTPPNCILLISISSFHICKFQYICSGLQLLYELTQLSLRYNERFSFHIAKVYLEHFTTTYSKFCNTLRIVFFQVASNCCLRNIIKNIFVFRFCLCYFSIHIYIKMQALKSW